MTEPISLFQGDEKTVTVTVAAGGLSGASALTFVAQKGKEAAAAAIEITLGSGVTIVSDTEFSIAFGKAHTETLKPEKYDLQARVVDAGGKQRHIDFDAPYLLIKHAMKYT